MPGLEDFNDRKLLLNLTDHPKWYDYVIQTIFALGVYGIDNSNSQAIITPPKATFHIHKEHLSHENHQLLSKIVETLSVTANKSQLLNSTAPTQVPPTDAVDMIDSGHKECK